MRKRVVVVLHSCVYAAFHASENECGRDRNLFSNSDDVNRRSCPFSVVGTFAGHLLTYSVIMGAGAKV